MSFEISRYPHENRCSACVFIVLSWTPGINDHDGMLLCFDNTEDPVGIRDIVRWYNNVHMIRRTASEAPVYCRKFSIVQNVCILLNLDIEDNESLVVNMCPAHYHQVQVCHNDTVVKPYFTVKTKIIFRCYLITTIKSHLVLWIFLAPSEHFLLFDRYSSSRCQVGFDCGNWFLFVLYKIEGVRKLTSKWSRESDLKLMTQDVSL